MRAHLLLPRPDRQPRAPGLRRLDAAPEPARLDRFDDERRRHDDGLGRRGAPPGGQKDIVGLKALAITAQRAFDNFRPGGVKVLAARR